MPLDLLIPTAPAQRQIRVVDAVTRRTVLVGGAGLLGLSGCSPAEDETGNATTRTVHGSRGPVQVPTSPQRVAALVGSNDLDVLALGITPVYAGTFGKGWTDLPEGIVTDEAVPPKLETVASARPDLLLGWNWLVDEPVWSKLTELAPGVPLPEGRPWRETFLVLADAVNRRAQGESLVADFDRRLGTLRPRFAEKRIRVAHVGFYKPGTMNLFGQDRDTSALMTALGFHVTGPAKTAQDVSTERLGELTAPWLIVYGGGDNGASALGEVKRTPLWKTLPAVRAGQVIEVEAGLWAGAGLLWAQALVDDLERRFLS